MKISPENIRIALFIWESWMKNSIRVLRSKSVSILTEIDSDLTDRSELQTEEWIKVKKVVKGVHLLSPFIIKKRKCLMEALIVYSTLKKLGIHSIIRIGTQATPDKSIHAHAWVSKGSKIIIGGPVKEYKELVRIR